MGGSRQIRVGRPNNVTSTPLLPTITFSSEHLHPPVLHAGPLQLCAAVMCTLGRMNDERLLTFDGSHESTSHESCAGCIPHPGCSYRQHGASQTPGTGRLSCRSGRHTSVLSGGSAAACRQWQQLFRSSWWGRAGPQPLPCCQRQAGCTSGPSTTTSARRTSAPSLELLEASSRVS